MGSLCFGGLSTVIVRVGCTYPEVKTNSNFIPFGNNVCVQTCV